MAITREQLEAHLKSLLEQAKAVRLLMESMSGPTTQVPSGPVPSVAVQAPSFRRRQDYQNPGRPPQELLKLAQEAPESESNQQLSERLTAEWARLIGRPVPPVRPRLVQKWRESKGAEVRPAPEQCLDPKHGKVSVCPSCGFTVDGRKLRWQRMSSQERKAHGQKIRRALQKTGKKSKAR